MVVRRANPPAANPRAASKGELLREIRQLRRQNRPPEASKSELQRQIRDLERQNEKLQATLDEVAELAEAPPKEEEETEAELADKLNEILDVVAGEEAEKEDDGDDND